MEVALSGPQTLSEPQRRRTSLPLSQLVEETQSRASIPNHLLESKIYATLKSNSLIQVEPSELHFSGFELGKDYIKTVKLINVSSEVMNIHVIPTQTKYFQTTYIKKYRLIPGLAYTLKVGFCPDEWRYFYDCIRVHCKGEDNLLIPVHAYPVIDDLRIPTHIDLPAVALRQSVCHAIPLRCSCPVGFEFRVYVIQSHESFSIHPLTGVIPAEGEATITVTFCPVQFETSQITFQLVISQFNTKPYLCTITGSCAPHVALSELEKKLDYRDAMTVQHKGASRCAPVLPRSKAKYRAKEADKSKTMRDPAVDVCTPAGVAKMLIKDSNKLSSKHLKQAISSGSMTALQNKQIKEAFFMKKVQQNIKAEQTNHLKWQVHLGMDPMSEHAVKQTLEEREIALHEYMVKRGDVRREECFAAGLPKLSSGPVLCEVGQAPEGAPVFQFYTTFQWELRRRVLRLFMQAARKVQTSTFCNVSEVVIRCRMNRRLASLKKLADSMKNLPSAQKVEEVKTCDLKVFPSSFPFSPNEDDPLANIKLVEVPVDPVDVTVTSHIPFFKLQVPLHYKLMGYRAVSAWETFNSYIPTALARPLRTGAPDKLVPSRARSPRTGETTAGAAEKHQNKDKDVEAEDAPGLSFHAPENLLRPFPANPLRIFNPAPGLQTFKPPPKYLESDLEFHLCPLPRYTVPESTLCGIRTQTPHVQKKFLDHKEVIPGVMKWKNFDSFSLKSLSNHPALTSDCAPCRSVNYNTDIFPLTAPPPLANLPDDVTPLMDTLCEGSGVQLTPEMIRAEFLSGEVFFSSSNLATGKTTMHQRQRQAEATYSSEFNQMGKRVLTRLKELGATDRTSHLPGENCD